MKRQKYILVGGVSALFLFGLNSCKKSFLEPQPFGRYSQEQIQNKKGVEGLLVGAYGMIDGQGIAGASGWMVGATNWVYGDVASDDAYKGTDANDQLCGERISIADCVPSKSSRYEFPFLPMALL